MKGGASWFVAEGAEEVKGASSMPLAKAMDDCSRGLRHERRGRAAPARFPLRLMVPGFEGIFHTKYLRRIKLVDRYYMNYNDYGHLRSGRQGRRCLGLPDRDRSRSSRSLPDAAVARPRILRDQRPGLVRWRRHSQGGGLHRRRQALEERRDSRERHSAWRIPGSAYRGTGTEKRPSSCRAARTNSARFNRREPRSPSTSERARWIRHTACRDWTTPFSRGGSPAMGACTNGFA